MKTLVPNEGDLMGGREFVDFSDHCQDGLPHDDYIKKATNTLFMMNRLLNEELTEPISQEEFFKKVGEYKDAWLKSLYECIVFLFDYTTIYRQIYDKLKENLAAAMIKHRVTLEEQIKELDQNYV